MTILSYAIYQISHLFIISNYFELSSIALYQIVIDPLYLVFFDERQELIFLQLNIIANMSNLMLIFQSQNISSMLLSYFSYQLIKHIKILNNDKIIKAYKFILLNTIWKPSEEEEVDEDMKRTLKMNTTLNDDKEFPVLNSNTRKLGLILTDIISIFAMIPYLANRIMKSLYIEQTEENLLNMQIFCTMLMSSFILDIANYFIIMKTSQLKDGKYFSNIFRFI